MASYTVASLNAVGDNLRLLEYAMINKIVATGSGRVPEVLDFQQFVNLNLPLLNEAMRQWKPDLAAQGVRFVKLVEDGAYGTNTAAALTMGLALTAHSVISPLPPTRSSGVAAWYAQNKTAIDELITATSAAADSSVVLDVAQAPIAAPPPAPATLTEDIQSAVNGSGATVLTSDVGVDLPVETDATVEQRRRRRKRRRAREQAERDGAAAAAALAQQTEVTFDEPDEAVVYGTARKGGVPIVAVGVGVVVLGGALWWMSRKGRRRAA